MRLKILLPLGQNVRNVSSVKDKKIVILSTSLFLIIFLNIFSPFGINNESLDPLFILLTSVYGVITAIILFAFEFGIKRYIRTFNKEQIYFYQLVCWYIFITAIISIANYEYYFLLKLIFSNSQFQFPGKSFLFFLKATFLTAAIIFLGLVIYFRYYYKTSRIIHIKNHVAGKLTEGHIEIWAENKRESFSVAFCDLLFIEKRDNYAVIVFLKNNQVERKLIRTSLKEIESRYIKKPLTRCHSSFIVNIAKVIDYKGNSKGLKLAILDYDQPVPVSARYYNKMISELNEKFLSTPKAS